MSRVVGIVVSELAGNEAQGEGSNEQQWHWEGSQLYWLHSLYLYGEFINLWTSDESLILFYCLSHPIALLNSLMVSWIIGSNFFSFMDKKHNYLSISCFIVPRKRSYFSCLGNFQSTFTSLPQSSSLKVIPSRNLSGLYKLN